MMPLQSCTKGIVIWSSEPHAKSCTMMAKRKRWSRRYLWLSSGTVSQFDPDHGTFKTWLLQCFSETRRQRSQEVIPPNQSARLQ
jgi:hypothetical protein